MHDQDTRCFKKKNPQNIFYHLHHQLFDIYNTTISQQKIDVNVQLNRSLNGR